MFIGNPGATSDKAIPAHFDNAFEEANARARSGEGYLMSGLRAFHVAFA